MTPINHPGPRSTFFTAAQPEEPPPHTRFGRHDTDRHLSMEKESHELLLLARQTTSGWGSGNQKLEEPNGLNLNQK